MLRQLNEHLLSGAPEHQMSLGSTEITRTHERRSLLFIGPVEHTQHILGSHQEVKSHADREGHLTCQGLCMERFVVVWLRPKWSIQMTSSGVGGGGVGISSQVCTKGRSWEAGDNLVYVKVIYWRSHIRKFICDSGLLSKLYLCMRDEGQFKDPTGPLAKPNKFHNFMDNLQNPQHLL